MPDYTYVTMDSCKVPITPLPEPNIRTWTKPMWKAFDSLRRRLLRRLRQSGNGRLPTNQESVK